MKIKKQNKAINHNSFVNLASEKFGSIAYKTNDEFFAPLKRLLNDKDPIFIPDKYDNHGKWMDGWETRRRREPGYDWCIIKLGCPGIISSVDIDTNFFTGNFPPFASLEACFSNTPPLESSSVWEEIISKKTLHGDESHNFISNNKNIFNWVKLKIYPDGGVARLRLWGNVFNDWEKFSKVKNYELSSLYYGGKILSYNNAHYGDVSALLAKGRGKNMGDGWETRRRRKPGNDWIVIELGTPGIINKIEIDTAFFKGNFPDSCSVEGVLVKNISDLNKLKWKNLLPQTKLKADKIHTFERKKILLSEPFSHLRLNIFPDGGVSRFRAFGQIQ